MLSCLDYFEELVVPIGDGSENLDPEFEISSVVEGERM